MPANVRVERGTKHAAQCPTDNRYIRRWSPSIHKASLERVVRPDRC
jgi:hypothetical protein